MMTTPLEQLKAMRSLEENWDGYGAAPPRADLIDLASEFVHFMQALRRQSSTYQQILASPTRTGGVLLEWDDDQREHEVEFNPDGSLGFLHVNKLTGEMETRHVPTPHAARARGGLSRRLPFHPAP
jgi:hypothetical protein